MDSWTGQNGVLDPIKLLGPRSGTVDARIVPHGDAGTTSSSMLVPGEDSPSGGTAASAAAAAASSVLQRHSSGSGESIPKGGVPVVTTLVGAVKKEIHNIPDNNVLPPPQNYFDAVYGPGGNQQRAQISLEGKQQQQGVQQLQSLGLAGGMLAGSNSAAAEVSSTSNNYAPTSARPGPAVRPGFARVAQQSTGGKLVDGPPPQSFAAQYPPTTVAPPTQYPPTTVAPTTAAPVVDAYATTAAPLAQMAAAPTPAPAAAPAEATPAPAAAEDPNVEKGWLWNGPSVMGAQLPLGVPESKFFFLTSLNRVLNLQALEN